MMNSRSFQRLVRGFLFTFTVLLLQEVLSQPAICQEFCAKPLAITDRWNDEDGDGHYDHAEPLTVDINENGQYDPAEGDQYNDLNQDGTFDDTNEFYDPIGTGYLAPGDVGAQLVLMFDGNAGPVVLGQYYPVAFPPVNRGEPLTGADIFRIWLEECSPFGLAVSDTLLLEPGGLTDIVLTAFLGFFNEDPSAYWDSATQSVQGSQFAQSPRIVTLIAFDPEAFPESGRSTLILSKFLSLFLESIGPGYRYTMRIVDAGLGVPTPNFPTTWGSLKNRY